MAYTTIDNPELYFQTKLYTGTAGAQALTLDGDENMQPNFVWLKRRDGGTGYSHMLYDSVRGATKHIKTNATAVEVAVSDALTSFDSDGFTLGANTAGTHATEINYDGGSYVSWNWKESATAGFDIVSYAGTGSAKTEAHSLSAVPKLIIVKNRDAADAWQVYHGANTAAPETDHIVLNTTAATADAADRWNDTAPTSSVFSLGDGVEVNTNTENYIAYCFAEKQGFSKFGSYKGNVDNDGPFIYTGFKPAFVMIKITTAVNDWNVWDNKRDPINTADGAHIRFRINTAEAENPNSAGFDILSNGFKIRNTYSEWNASGTFIYAAFAEAPFVNSNGVPCNAR